MTCLAVDFTCLICDVRDDEDYNDGLSLGFGLRASVAVVNIDCYSVIVQLSDVAGVIRNE